MKIMNWVSLTCLLTIFSLTNATLHPLLFVPGLFNSALVAKIAKIANISEICRPKDGRIYFRSFFDLIYAAEHTIKCIYDLLQLFYNLKTHTTSNREGVDVKTYLNVTYVEALDEAKALIVYRVMIEHFETKYGYKRNVSLFGAAYDFRKGPCEPEVPEFCKKFKQLIIDAFNMNNGKRVIIIYHSMGSIVTRFCLRGYSQKFKDKYIFFIISLAGVYGGTVKILDVLTGGRLYGTEFLPGENLFSNRGLLSLLGDGQSKILKPLLDKIPSNATSFEALPQYAVEYWTSLPWLAPIKEAFHKKPFVRTQTRDYTVETMRDYFRDIGGEKAAQIYDDTYKFTKNPPPTGVKIYCFFGYNIETMSRINHKGKTPKSPKAYPTNGNGDGLVNLVGLNCSITEENRNSSQNITYKPIIMLPFKDYNHLSFLYSGVIINHIDTIMKKEIENENKK